jgi:hypothetical protein
MTTELRHAPVQARSKKRLRSILQAGEEILAEVGRDRLTSALVAQRAGTSIGTFYRYFTDRVALLDQIAPMRDGHQIIDGVDQITALPHGSVLLCRANEVFWLPPTLDRLWFAAGYDPAEFTWTDAQVADWGPHQLLHRGTKP